MAAPGEIGVTFAGLMSLGPAVAPEMRPITGNSPELITEIPHP
jgi:hypothetical protein